MWANRITLDFVKHNDAKAKIQSKLDEKGATDEWITDLHISTDGGYVYYVVTLSDKSCFTIFDNGTELHSLHYRIDELDNMKENAKFIIEHNSEIDKNDWMNTVINLVDDCKKLRNDR